MLNANNEGADVVTALLNVNSIDETDLYIKTDSTASTSLNDEEEKITTGK